MNFGKKHLSDPFLLEGVQAVSARDAILREIFSNSLAHRDYSTGYVAKFVIEKDKCLLKTEMFRMVTVNLNLMILNLFQNLNNYKNYTREFCPCRWRLGLGMAFKYTKLYSGGTPEFIEGDVFKIIIPLSKGGN